jgi:hypothetical protein
LKQTGGSAGLPPLLRVHMHLPPLPQQQQQLLLLLLLRLPLLSPTPMPVAPRRISSTLDLADWKVARRISCASSNRNRESETPGHSLIDQVQRD